nr:efflux RND transporter periplasmic adaptor subunit [Cytophagales bacterium]
MKIYNPIPVLALLTCLSACKEQKPEQAIASPETIAVTTYPLLQTEQAVRITATGLLATENEARYAFKIGGVIEQIAVQEGQSFSKGSLLASLRTDEIESGYAQAKLGMEKASRDLERIKNLYRDSVATLEQLQNTRTAFEIAQTQLDAVAFNREFASIYAISDGFVTKKLANIGEIISEGTPVLAINEADRDSWVLKVGLSDKDWTLVTVGDSVTVTMDAYPGLIITGSIFRKSQAADQTSGSFQVEARLDLGELQPAVGMFGKALIYTNVRRQYHEIPYDALLEADGNTAFVFVPNGEGNITRIPVVIAEFDDKMVRIKSGLEGIREVVRNNAAFLNESSTISIIQ